MSEEISRQDLEEFFAGLDSFLAGVSAVTESCPDDDCPVHTRSNSRKIEDTGQLIRITYQGIYAAYSYNLDDPQGFQLVRSEFYKVGDGTLNDVRGWFLATEKPGNDVDKIHDYYLNILDQIEQM